MEAVTEHGMESPRSLWCPSHENFVSVAAAAAAAAAVVVVVAAVLVVVV